MAENNSGSQPPQNGRSSSHDDPLLEKLGAQQLESWDTDDPIFVERYLERFPEVADNPNTILALISNEIHARSDRGEAPELEEYLQRFPDFEKVIRDQFGELKPDTTPDTHLSQPTEWGLNDSQSSLSFMMIDEEEEEPDPSSPLSGTDHPVALSESDLVDLDASAPIGEAADVEDENRFFDDEDIPLLDEDAPFSQGGTVLEEPEDEVPALRTEEALDDDFFAEESASAVSDGTVFEESEDEVASGVEDDFDERAILDQDEDLSAQKGTVFEDPVVEVPVFRDDFVEDAQEEVSASAGSEGTVYEEVEEDAPGAQADELNESESEHFALGGTVLEQPEEEELQGQTIQGDEDSQVLADSSQFLNEEELEEFTQEGADFFEQGLIGGELIEDDSDLDLGGVDFDDQQQTQAGLIPVSDESMEQIHLDDILEEDHGKTQAIEEELEVLKPAAPTDSSLSFIQFDDEGEGDGGLSSAQADSSDKAATGSSGGDDLMPDSSVSFIDFDEALGDSEEDPNLANTPKQTVLKASSGDRSDTDLDLQVSANAKPNVSYSLLSVESLQIGGGGIGGGTVDEQEGEEDLGNSDVVRTFHTSQGGTHEPTASQTDHEIDLPQSATDYEILKEIGRGGMGVVYKAKQKGLNRIVALKMLLGENVTDYRLTRFRAEAEVIARLRHTNIVQIFEFGALEGKPFFALEFVSGGSLHEVINRTPQEANFSVDLMIQMAEGMYLAHENGIIHRDLKPANVLMTEEGVPKITDFGLAKQFDDEDLGNTKTGAIMGTPSYMAPEQALGKVKEMGPPVDTYALGAIFYELLTGRPPFLAATLMDTLEQVRYEDPVPPSKLQAKIPKDLETICLKCLQKDPDKRYESSKALAEDLRRYQAGVPILARATRPWERWAKWAKRNPATAALILLGFLVTTGVVSGFLYLTKQSEQEAQRAATEARNEVIAANRKIEDQRLKAEEQQRKLELEQKKQAVQKLITDGATLIAQSPPDWGAAKAKYEVALANIREDQKNFGADLLKQAQQGIADAERGLISTAEKRKAQETLKQLAKPHSEAMFQSTLATGEKRPKALQITIDRANDVLDLMKIGRDLDGNLELNVAYEDQEKRDILRQCYEMLILRAEAEAQPAKFDNKPSKEQLEKALATLERAQQVYAKYRSLLADPASVPEKTKAYYLRRYRYLVQQKEQLSGAEVAQLDMAISEAKDKAESVESQDAMDHFLVGDDHFKNDQMDQAIASFEKTLANDSSHFWARYYVSVAYLRIRRFEAAEVSLSACLGAERKSVSVWVYLLRAFTYAQLQQYSKAEADFNEAEGLNPEPNQLFALFANRGLFYYQRGVDELAKLKNVRDRETIANIQKEADRWFEEAEDQLLAAINKDKEINKGNQTEFAPSLTLAQVYVKQEKWQLAENRLTEASQLAGNFPDLYRLLASLQIERKDDRKDYRKALENVTTAIKLIAEGSDEKQKDQVPALHVLQGRILYKQGLDLNKEAGNANDAAMKTKLEKLAKLDYDAAIEAYNKAVELGEKLIGGVTPNYGRKNFVGAWLGLGDAYLKLEKYQMAADNYDKYLNYGGEPKASVFRGRGFARSGLGDNSGAVDDYTSALRLKPDDTVVLIQRGLKRLSDGADSLARSDFSKAIEFLLEGRSPRDIKDSRERNQLATAYNARAKTWLKSGNSEQALADFDLARNFNPGNADPSYGRAQVFMQQRNYTSAEEDFGEVLRVEPKDGDAFQGRAAARLSLKKYAQAIGDFDRAIQIFQKALKDLELNDKVKKERLQIKLMNAYLGRSRAWLFQNKGLQALEDATLAEKAAPGELGPQTTPDSMTERFISVAKLMAIAGNTDPNNRQAYLGQAFRVVQKAIIQVQPRERLRVLQTQVDRDPAFQELIKLPEYKTLRQQVQKAELDAR